MPLNTLPILYSTKGNLTINKLLSHHPKMGPNLLTNGAHLVKEA